MRKIVVLGLLLLVVLLGCNQDNITGGATTETIEVSTLTVLVNSENGTVLEDARVYVNSEYKGKTVKYGEKKGTRTVVLKGDDNVISVTKAGYADSKATEVKATLRGLQFITVTLWKERAEYEVKIIDSDGQAVEDARVVLHKGNDREQARTVDGIAFFDRIDDGEYEIVISKQGYERTVKQAEIDLTKDPSPSSIFTLLPEAELIVEVVDESGDLLHDVEVALYTKEEYNSPSAWPLATQYTNREGNVRFDSVEHDEKYAVVAKKSGYLAQVQIKKVEGNNKYLLIELLEDLE